MGLRDDFRSMASDVAANFGDVRELGTYRVPGSVVSGGPGKDTVTWTESPLEFFVFEFASDDAFPGPVEPEDWKCGIPGESLTGAPALNAQIVRADGSVWKVAGTRNEDGIGAWWELHMTRAS